MYLLLDGVLCQQRGEWVTQIHFAGGVNYFSCWDYAFEMLLSLRGRLSLSILIGGVCQLWSFSVTLAFVLIVSSLAFVASPCLWGSSLLDYFLFFLLLLYFCLNKFVWCGVVNALIKGEIEMPVGLGPCDEWLNNTVCVWRFSWLVSLQVIGGDWTCGDVWRMKIWCHADGLRAVKGGSRLAFEGFEIVRCMSTVPDDTARERWWTVSWLSHKTKIPDVRCGGRGRRRGQLSIARRFRIIVRRDHGTPWC
jgi:hypothetical protein